MSAAALIIFYVKRPGQIQLPAIISLRSTCQQNSFFRSVIHSVSCCRLELSSTKTTIWGRSRVGFNMMFTPLPRRPAKIKFSCKHQEVLEREMTWFQNLSFSPALLQASSDVIKMLTLCKPLSSSLTVRSPCPRLTVSSAGTL